MNMESLDQSIKDYNNWNGAALIYYNKEEGYFNTEVFANDVNKVETTLADGNFIVFSKSESEKRQIGEVRKEYIIDFVSMVLDGWLPDQVEYKLYGKYQQV